MTTYSAFTRRPFLQALCRGLLTLLGWRLEPNFPAYPQYMLIFAHHTSNWDFPLGLLAAFAMGFWPQWVGKDSLFRWPLGGIMRWLGGVPVIRAARLNFVDQIVTLFQQQPNLIIAVAPEGTRRKTDHWKTGFYYIAQGAGVPIVTSYLDYKRKIGGIGPVFMPTGDIAADLARIAEFYQGITGRHPELHGNIQLRPSATKN